MAKNTRAEFKTESIMAKAYIANRMEQSFMMVDGKMIIDMVMEFLLMGTVADMKANGKMTNKMVKGHNIGQMAINMRGNGKMESIMAKAYTTTRMEQSFMMVNGKMMIDIVMV
jgi:hypothetical protein